MSAPSGRVVSGKAVVFVMFAFGSVATGVLWLFWSYHTLPFIPLQKAISAAYPGSAPRVDGGQRKMHADTPRLLWIVMRVNYDPINDKPEAQGTVDRVVAMAHQHVDTAVYDQINVRLFRGEPERRLHTQDFEVPLRTEPLKTASE